MASKVRVHPPFTSADSPYGTIWMLLDMWLCAVQDMWLCKQFGHGSGLYESSSSLYESRVACSTGTVSRTAKLNLAIGMALACGSSSVPYGSRSAMVRAVQASSDVTGA